MGSLFWAPGKFVQVGAHHVLLPLCNWDNKIIPPTNQSSPLLLCPKACPSTRHCKIYKIIFCSSICFHLHLLLHPQLCHTIQRQSPSSSLRLPSTPRLTVRR